jgi:pathogenesis-related protein 1
MRFSHGAIIIIIVTIISGIVLLYAGPPIAAPPSSSDNGKATADKTQIIAKNEDTRRSKAKARMLDRSSIGSTLTLWEVEQLLQLHNKARANVRVGPLSWSKQLAIYAQEWANHLASARCRMEHRPNSGKWKQEHGENLFIGTAGYYGVADAVKAWVDEKEYYRGGTLNFSNWHASGHYTQVVWKDTKQLGCAKAECKGNIIIVCNYDPPGNVLGEKPY